MWELWPARTTTMLASSAATASPLRTISPVMASSTAVTGEPYRARPSACLVGSAVLGADAQRIQGVRRRRPRGVPARPVVAVPRRAPPRPGRAKGAGRARALQPGYRRRPVHPAHHDHLRAVPEGD